MLFTFLMWLLGNLKLHMWLALYFYWALLVWITILWLCDYYTETLFWNKKSSAQEYQFSSVQSLSRVQLFATPWTAARQASLSITSSQSLLRLISIGWVMPSNHLILWCPLLLLPSIFPSIRVFSSESVLHIRWPKYWSFSFSISPSGLISLRMDSFNLLAVQGLSRVFSKEGKTTIVSELWCKYNSVDRKSVV